MLPSLVPVAVLCLNKSLSLVGSDIEGHHWRDCKGLKMRQENKQDLRKYGTRSSVSPLAFLYENDTMNTGLGVTA